MIHTWHDTPVPYVTSWSQEIAAADQNAQLLRIRTIYAEGREPRHELVYLDETPADRDRHGLLWSRMPDEPGTGRPLFGAVHPTRQRACMLSESCQICAGAASVWMTPADAWDEHVRILGATAPFTITDAPVCEACADLAVGHCTKLKDEGRVLLTATRWAPTMVRGMRLNAACDDWHDREANINLPGTIPPPDLDELRRFLAMVQLATLWQPTVLARPADSPGLGTPLAGLQPRPRPEPPAAHTSP